MKNTLSNSGNNVATVQENRAKDREAIPALLRNQLSHEEWATIMPPLYTKEINFNRWKQFEWQVCCKWLAQNTTGWWYWDTKNWLVFEKIDDHILFTMWAKNEPMERNGSMSVQIP